MTTGLSALDIGLAGGLMFFCFIGWPLLVIAWAIEKKIDKTVTVRCVACGRFISYQDMEAGNAHFHFEPDSHRGPEINEWTCKSCVDKETK